MSVGIEWILGEDSTPDLVLPWLAFLWFMERGEKGEMSKRNDLKYLFIFHKNPNPTISGFFTPQDHIPNPITYKDSISEYYQCLGLEVALYKRRSITNNYSKAVTKMNSVH